MQQLKLLEDPPPAGVVPVWNVLDEPQRAEVFRVALFPAVFSKMVATNGTVMTTASRGA